MNKLTLCYYEFGPYRLNATERLLQRDTETVPLTPKVFDTLLILVENSGHVLAKNELMEMLWPDSFVEESSLTQNISLLRRALGEVGSEQLYIETIPKRGYRFVAEVRELQDPIGELVLQERTTTEITIEEQQVENGFSSTIAEAIDISLNRRPNRSRTRMLFVAGVVVLVGALVAAFFYASRSAHRFNPKSVAILPFMTIGQSQSDAELQGLGIADALINRLSRLDQPIVLPTSSIYRYTNREKDALAIGRELGVDAVLDGTLQRDGQRIRVTAQLIRLSDGKPIWSAKYDEEYRGTFALQDSVAGQMATAIVPQISKDARQQLANRPTDNADAYKAYLTGIYFWHRRTEENLPKATQYLEEAVQTDPNFGLAHAILADCYYVEFDASLGGVPNEQAKARAYSESEKALSLDEGITEAHTVRAGLALVGNDRITAEREFRRALELNPGYPVVHFRYGYFLFAGGQLQEALGEMKRAQELDPVSTLGNIALGYVLFMSGDNAGAISSYKRAIELQPDFPNAHFLLIDAYVNGRMFEEALAESEKVGKFDSFTADLNRAYIYAASGRRAEATKLLSKLSEVKGRTVGAYDQVVIRSSMEDNDSALNWLKKVDSAPLTQSMLKFDPRLESIRKDPRFNQYAKRDQRPTS